MLMTEFQIVFFSPRYLCSGFLLTEYASLSVRSYAECPVIG